MNETSVKLIWRKKIDLKIQRSSLFSFLLMSKFFKTFHEYFESTRATNNKNKVSSMNRAVGESSDRPRAQLRSSTLFRFRKFASNWCRQVHWHVAEGFLFPETKSVVRAFIHIYIFIAHVYKYIFRSSVIHSCSFSRGILFVWWTKKQIINYGDKKIALDANIPWAK